MFSNIGSDANIDWATLAQQWIQRNTKENSTINEAPPPPNISNLYEKKSRNYAGYDEKGEADMEMEDDEQPPPAPPMMPLSPDGTKIYAMQSMIGNDENSHRIDSSASWNSWMNPPNPVSTQSFTKSSPTAHIPSLLKINVPNPNDPTKPEEVTSDNSISTLDAAKRKVLPAWIREGLEKMEREKQKHLEREQQLKDRGIENPTTLSGVISSTDITVKDHVAKPLESGDSSGNEHDDDDDDQPFKAININTKSKEIGNVEVRAQVSSNVSNKNDDDDDNDAVAPALFVGKSYELRLANLMISVRRTLTELLLEVTNEEIAQIAKETLNSYKLKASSAQVVRKSALSSITNRLGLAAYSSSGDESDSDNSSNSGNNDGIRENHRHGRGGNNSTAAEDSEEEIKTKLRMRRRAFAKTTEEIEERVALNASREEQKLRYYKQKELQQQKKDNDSENDDEEDDDTMPANSSISSFSGIGKNNARNFGETTTESKLQQSNGKKSKDRSGSRRGERTTRFSDNKDKNSIAVTATYMSQLAPTSVSTPVTTVANTTVHGFHIASNVASAMGSFDVNMYTPSTAAAAAGINTMLNAAEAALEKAAKCKNLSGSTSSSRTKPQKSNDKSRDRERRQRTKSKKSRHRSSDDSDSSTTTNDDSTDSSTSSSSTSKDSKHSRASSNSTSRHKRSSHYSRSHSSRYRERYDEQRHQRHHHHKRSRDEYDERTKSRHTSTSKQTRRSKDRSRSRSHSTYSSSSSKRHNHHRH